MKSASGQLFAIGLLALLAALSFWLAETVNVDGQADDGKKRHDPDAIAENFTMRQFDETGRVKYRLTSPYLKHFADDDSSELKSPTLINFRLDAPPLTLSGNNARVTSKGEVIYLWDDVRALRAATPERPEMVATMPDLTIEPNAGLAHTKSPVEVHEADSWVKGVGMNLDNNTSTLVLQSQVTGLLQPRRAPK